MVVNNGGVGKETPSVVGKETPSVQWRKSRGGFSMVLNDNNIIVQHTLISNLCPHHLKMSRHIVLGMVHSVQRGPVKHTSDLSRGGQYNILVICPFVLSSGRGIWVGLRKM